jgi:predicted ATP-binding protein involved in virulence
MSTSTATQANQILSIIQSELKKKTKVQHKLEKAMLAAQSAAISKNQFLANMSHEVP